MRKLSRLSDGAGPCVGLDAVSVWCARRDSNPQHPGPKPGALSVELRTQCGSRDGSLTRVCLDGPRTRRPYPCPADNGRAYTRILVPSEGFEPPTFAFVARRSIQLSYEGILVRSGGFEPPAFGSANRRSVPLIYDRNLWWGLSTGPCRVRVTPSACRTRSTDKSETGEDDGI